MFKLVRKRKISTVIAGLAVTAFIATGCSSSSDDSAAEVTATTAETEASEAPAEAVSISWAHACGLPGCWYHVPLYIAQNFGFFEEFGVDVDIQPFKSGGDIVQAVQSGDIDGGHIGTDPFLVGAPQGLAMKGIYGENKQDWILITRDPEVQSCTDLAGKEVGAQGVCDARILSIFEGAAEIQAQVIARRLLG